MPRTFLPAKTAAMLSGAVHLVSRGGIARGVCVTLMLAACCVLAFGAIPLSTSTPATQNFDGMGIPATATTPSTLPTDFRVDALTTVRTVGTFSLAVATTARAGGANLSTTAANGTYNFGSGTATLGGSDRAVGFLASGTATTSGNLYAQFVNNTGSSLSSLQISYSVEKYRGGINAAGFRIQLFYSTDGIAWTNAGGNFLTSFTPDSGTNAGFSPAPGLTVPVSNQTLSVSIPNGSNFFLAWNYSVTSGSTVTNAQALAIDDISILGVAGNAQTNPTGTGSANPSTVQAGNSTTLTVAVTPGTNPASTGLAVTGDLTSIGGSATQQFFDDASHGDSVAGDNVFSFQFTVPAATSSGVKTIPAAITDAQARTGSASISLTVTPSSTPPTGLGAAAPNSLQAGDTSLLTVTVTPGSNPVSTGIGVVVDLSPIGGSSTQQFFDDGTNGDATLNNNVFSFQATVTAGTSAGTKSLLATITDAQARTSTATISLTVQPPPPPTTVKISQVYGGGGNSGSTYRNDFIEIYNQSTTPVDITGWTVQYSTSNTTSWTTTSVCPQNTCMILPGRYYLVQESQGAGGTTSLPAADASGTIAMGATNGKVALVASLSPLSGACPTGGLTVDLVSYGSTNCPISTGALSNTTAAVRKGNGCIDTGNNTNDFVIIGPIPRNSSAPANSCGGDPTEPSGLGLASPASVLPAANTLLTVKITPATTPPSTGFVVSANLNGIAGAASQQFYDDGTHGDQVAGDNVFSFLATVGPTIPTGVKYITATITDAQGRTVTAPITVSIESPTCGVERWSVKTGTDPDALLVNLNSPMPGTIADLGALTAPVDPPGPPLNARIQPTETTVYVVNATMTLYKKETDVDYHVVIQDDLGRTMIVEIPSPACVGPTSPFAPGIALARAKLDNRFDATSFFQTANIPVQVKGVGFFDFIHGQTGVAPNGIELHPVLDINFTTPTITTLASNINPSQFGQTVAITAAVSNGGAVMPTGHVTLFDAGSPIGTTVLDPSGLAAFNIGNFSTSSHPLTASYEGDSTSAPSNSTQLIQVVNKADQTIAFGPLGGKTFGDPDFTVNATASSGLAVSFSIVSGPATVSGNTVHIAGAGGVTVRASQGGNSNYNAAADVDQPFTVAKANQTIAFAPLPDKTFGDASFVVSATGGASTQLVQFVASGTCSISGNTVTITGAGSCTITASQAGDDNYNPATPVSRSFTINKAPQAVVIVSAPADGTFGQTGLAATASGGSGTGAYSFSAGSSTACTVDAATGAIGITAGTGTCSLTASRAGDANYNASAPSAAVAINIHKAASPTSAASSKNPSTFGDSVTFTASVTPTSATGAVQFKIDGNNFGSPIALVAGNATSGNISSLTAGSHSVTAAYSGDNNFAGSIGSLTQVVNRAATSAAVASNLNPSLFGQSVTFSAMVTSAGGVPTGTVTFMDGTVSIGTAGLNASGQAAIATPFLLAGTHSITVAYGGDNNFSASTSAPLAQIVGQANTSTSLASSQNPSSSGQSVTFTATTSAIPPGAGIPTGTIAFKDGTAVLATVALDGAGQATYTTATLALGTHSITAVYSGDANFTGGTSAPLSQLVFAYLPDGGSFVIGDLNAVVGKSVTFWDSQWGKSNGLSGGPAPSSFNGFANTTSTNPPSQGGTWTSDPANSSGPPSGVPSYMAVIASSSVTKSGSAIAGNIPMIVIVRTDPGYSPNGGHTGTGTVVAVLSP